MTKTINVKVFNKRQLQFLNKKIKRKRKIREQKIEKILGKQKEKKLFEYYEKLKSIEKYNEFFKNKLHYGHSPKQLNPKMQKYLFEWGSLPIKMYKRPHDVIDVRHTKHFLEKACSFLKQQSAENKLILFVGTKYHARLSIKELAINCNQFYIDYRWVGGMLSNWLTIKNQLKKLKFLEKQKDNGELKKLPIKEYNKTIKNLEKLKKYFEGIKEMSRVPDVVIITHELKDLNAVRECKKLGITTVGLLDTNCDPDLIDYVIPGNDDSYSSVRFILSKLSDSILEGSKINLNEEKLTLKN